MMLQLILTLAAFAPPAAAVAPSTAAQPIPRAQFIVQMDSQFRQMDADKNGQLTQGEIDQYQKLAATAEAKARNQALFKQLDANKSGYLSPAEFAKLTAAAPPANAQPMLDREDSNRDSQISLVEHRSATLANFDRLDTDKNGIVTPTEMKAAGISR